MSHLEQRLQLQEDEIQLLKAALADALRRLGQCEEQNQGVQPAGAHAGRRPVAAAALTPPTKGKQLNPLTSAAPGSETLLMLEHRTKQYETKLQTDVMTMNNKCYSDLL